MSRKTTNRQKNDHKQTEDKAGLGTIRQQLSNDTLEKLRRLQTALPQQKIPKQVVNTSEKAESSAGVHGKGTDTAANGDDEPTFAELFSPKESQTDESFGSLLDESKLDWRKFK